MLKKPVTYTDFDGKTVTENLYFNITKTELTENFDILSKLQSDFESLQETLSGDKRDLTSEEIRAVLDLVKRIAAFAFGYRSEDGKRFIKNGAWEEFRQTAAYDAFVWGLFEKPVEAVNFLVGVMPADMQSDLEQQANALMKQAGLDTLPVDENVVKPTPLPDFLAEEKAVVVSAASLRDMSLDELQAELDRRAQQS